ncbi:MAG: CoA transferase [Deltaproteobacteria bacterium]|nr:CoA transferase [Deltaproteobacteria bacterium]
MKPLDGVRVLDLSRVLSGPFATMHLADMGADVVKLEHPKGGDDARAFGPPFIAGESTYFMSVNRGKRSVALDLKSERGREVVRALARVSDVCVENFRPGTLERLGLGLDGLRAENPRLVTCSITGYGQSGIREFSAKPGYDLIIQGLCGVQSLTGDPAGPPMKTGVSIADLASGLYAVQGILLALLVREKTGRGQHVDVSLQDALTSLLTFQAASTMTSGRTATRAGNRHPSIVPYETFRAADGYFNLAAANDGHFRKACEAIGRPDLARDVRFATNPDRVAHRDALFEELQAAFMTAPVDSWVSKFEAADIPAGRINTVAEALAHPQLRARGMVTTVKHPVTGDVPQIGIPVKLAETPGALDRPPPRLGEHTAEILAMLGIS